MRVRKEFSNLDGEEKEVDGVEQIVQSAMMRGRVPSLQSYRTGLTLHMWRLTYNSEDWTERIGTPNRVGTGFNIGEVEK